MKTIKLGLFLFLIAATAAFSQNIYLSGPTTPESVRTAIEAMKTDGTNADSPVFPGAVTVEGAFVASDGAEFRGTASAVKILGNPAAEADDDPTRPR